MPGSTAQPTEKYYQLLTSDSVVGTDRVFHFQFVNECNREIFHRDVAFASPMSVANCETTLIRENRVPIRSPSQGPLDGFIVYHHRYTTFSNRLSRSAQQCLHILTTYFCQSYATGIAVADEDHTLICAGSVSSGAKSMTTILHRAESAGRLPRRRRQRVLRSRRARYAHLRSLLIARR